MTLLDKYSDEEFKNIVESSNSFTEIMRKLGYSHSSRLKKPISERMEKLNIKMNPKKITQRNRNNEDVFIFNSTVAQTTLRRYYRKGNYSEYKCSICGQEPIWNSKPMSLVLDHIDGNNTNDKLDNLRWVCPNCNSQLDTTGSRNIKFRKKSQEKNNYLFCIDCGKEIKGMGKTQRCFECAVKYMNIINRNVVIQRDELKSLIRTKSFTEIGKMFDVSDNAIRKHCKKYNLPYRIRDIKAYSDEEWEDI